MHQSGSIFEANTEWITPCERAWNIVPPENSVGNCAYFCSQFCIWKYVHKSINVFFNVWNSKVLDLFVPQLTYLSSIQSHLSFPAPFQGSVKWNGILTRSKLWHQLLLQLLHSTPWSKLSADLTASHSFTVGSHWSESLGILLDLPFFSALP